MGTDLQVGNTGALTLPDIERRRRAKARALAPLTRDGYSRDLRQFERWCESQGKQARPASPETVSDYLEALAPCRKIATLRRHVAAIGAWHQQEGHPDPCREELVRDTLRGIARERGTDQRQAAPLGSQELERIVARVDGTRLKDLRDIALMRVGRDLLARASELVSLTVEAVSFTDEGALVRLRRHKTSTEAVPCLVGMEAAAALVSYLRAAGITDGPLFRALTKGGRVKASGITRRDVGRVLRELGERGKLGCRLSGHSLRVGMAQDLVAAEIGENLIMQAGGWGSSRMVARYASKLKAAAGAIARFYARRG
jgi:site-specific recombinase XerD